MKYLLNGYTIYQPSHTNIYQVLSCNGSFTISKTYYLSENKKQKTPKKSCICTQHLNQW